MSDYRINDPHIQAHVHGLSSRSVLDLDDCSTVLRDEEVDGRSQMWSRFPAFSTVPDQVSRPGGRLNEAHRSSQDVGATTC